MTVTELLDRFLDRETIGHKDCPLMLRWTFLDLTETRLARWLPMVFNYKAMVHFFPAEVEDKDPHDHPRSFVTFVLRGKYLDVRWESYTPLMKERGETGPIPEWVEAPAVRLRRAEYMHIVETGPGDGCWTLVVMGPPKRAWGFLRLGTKKWWPWERYVQKFGGTVRCDTDDGNRDHELERSGKHTPEDYKGTPPPWDALG